MAVRLNLDLDGENQITQVWRKTFNNFSGGKKDYSDVPAFGDAMIYTECWSITGLNYFFFWIFLGMFFSEFSFLRNFNPKQP